MEKVRVEKEVKVMEKTRSVSREETPTKKWGGGG